MTYLPAAGRYEPTVPAWSVGARRAALGNLAGSALPTADEIGAQVEEFLAGFEQPEDDK